MTIVPILPPNIIETCGLEGRAFNANLNDVRGALEECIHYELEGGYLLLGLRQYDDAVSRARVHELEAVLLKVEAEKRVFPAINLMLNAGISMGAANDSLRDAECRALAAA